MQTKLIEGARAALDNADSEIVLLLSDAQQLWPAALTVDGLEFDCLAGRTDADDPIEVWAVDCSGYWMHFDNLSAYLRSALQLALAEKLAEMKDDAADNAAWQRFESRWDGPAFPSLRGGL